MEILMMMHPPAKFNNMKRNIYLMMLLISLAGFRTGSNRNINGTVYDLDDKKPIAGVSVQVTGTNVYVKSDENGNYKIDVPESKTELTFSQIGYLTQKIKIGKKNQVDVWLKTNDVSLNEIIITGYQAQQKRSITTSAATTIQSLQGKVAGIMIRGKNSYNDQDNESYKGVEENRFTNPKQAPLSTFAVDVDAASYSNVRRFINSGQLPPKDAVRVEEMINYFKYDLQSPTNGDPVAIHTELSSAPWNPQHRLLRIGLKAKMIETAKLPPSNLVFLIDVSGSMSGANRLPLVKASLKLLVDQLRDIDHVAIVTYAGAAGLKLASTPGDQKIKIKEAIETLDAGGATAGGAGLKLAYSIATENFIKSGNNRIVLASDGDFNVGDSSDQDMEQLIVREQQSGISLSVFGFGMGNLKDSKMEVIADKGHGNYAYVDNISEARKAMVTEFGGTLFTVAKDVKLQIEFNPALVQAYRLVGYENRLMEKEDFNNDQKIGGDMGVGHTVTALYEIVPAGIKDSFLTEVDPLKYQKTPKAQVLNRSSEMVTIKFRYKNPDSDKSKMKAVVVYDTPVAFRLTSNDFRFSSAVAELGMLLRGSDFKQQSDFNRLIARAKGALGEDKERYRSEFIGMAENARLLSKSNTIAKDE